MPFIYFTVTNDLSYDQRMIRICQSLSDAGYTVHLIGRKKKTSIPLDSKSFNQTRIFCFFEKGKLFYIEYNLKLFFFLLFRRMDGICAIDLDTILPCLLVSKLKKIHRIYDAHELFCEMKEVVSRPSIHRIWKWIEKKTIPSFQFAYTVNQPIADEFRKMYAIDFEVIRSIASYKPRLNHTNREKFILYQGAVNEGRCFESLIPAMQWIECKLIICGDGNFMSQTREIVNKYNLNNKVIFKGMMKPEDLRLITENAYIGTTFCEKDSLSTYYSLANRFFDYMQSHLPQVCVKFPAYEELNNLYDIAVLIDDLSPKGIALSINELLNDEEKWQRLHENSKIASIELSWQNEEKKLIQFYKKIFG